MKSMIPRNPKIDFFFEKDTKWKSCYHKLRHIILHSELGKNSQLSEVLKWGKPCYTFQKKNLVLIHGFKNYCALLFHKGVLLKDPENVLIQQTENVQSARQIRFTNEQEIEEMAPIIKDYIYEAIEVEKSGLKVEFKKTKAYSVPEEFQKKVDEDPDLKNAFEALTPGRRRGYLLYFSKAKQSKTRESRVEKCIPNILDGKGLRDQ